MNSRILHCSTSLENYYLCLEHRVAGFTNRGPQVGDRVYLVVKVGKKSLCGARFILDEPADNKPWADADNFLHALSIKDIEYCQIFDVAMLDKLSTFKTSSVPLNYQTSKASSLPAMWYNRCKR